MTARVSADGRLTSFGRDGLVFDVVDRGPLDGEVVVLLHGFPQRASSWDLLAPLLHASGYRTLAPDQRGYSPRARPRGRFSYRMSQLTKDVVALIEAAEPGHKVHVVGHDWGAAVAWTVAAARPDAVATLTALSVPHPAAFMRALFTSRQFLLSWYMYVFQLALDPGAVDAAGSIPSRHHASPSAWQPGRPLPVSPGTWSSWCPRALSPLPSTGTGRCPSAHRASWPRSLSRPCSSTATATRPWAGRAANTYTGT